LNTRIQRKGEGDRQWQRDRHEDSERAKAKDYKNESECEKIYFHIRTEREIMRQIDGETETGTESKTDTETEAEAETHARMHACAHTRTHTITHEHKTDART